MIRYTKGNLLDSEAQALVNTVNTVGVMGKGIALQFKERFPDNYKLYHKACKESKVVVGKMFVTCDTSLTGSKIIINFPTKSTWRRPSEYSYIEAGLEDLRRVILSSHIQSIAIPPLGSHNGGLEWARVKAMIEQKLEGLDCDIILYEPSDMIIERLKKEKVKLTIARAMMLDVLCDLVAYGEFVSVFAAEKVVYFLQRFGAQSVFNIEYKKYRYGPYSGGKVAHVLYYLNGSYIKGLTGMQARPFEELWLLPDTRSIVCNYLNLPENEFYKNICEKTKAFLRGFYSAYGLELLSTVDFILQNDENDSGLSDLSMQEKVEILKEDIKAWSDRKDKLFGKSDFLPIVLEHLEKTKFC